MRVARLAMAFTLVIVITACGCGGGIEDVAGTTDTVSPSGSLDILSHSTYINSIGTRVIVGEVQNNTNYDAEFVKIFVTLYDSAGRAYLAKVLPNPKSLKAEASVIDTDYTYADLDVIPLGGGKSPFKIYTSNGYDAKNYTLSVEGSVGSFTDHKIEVLSHSSYTNSIGTLVITGEVKNNSDRSKKFIKILATLYNSDGNVVETDFTYSDRDVLSPGETSGFKMYVSYPNGYSTYSLMTEADNA